MHLQIDGMKFSSRIDGNKRCFALQYKFQTLQPPSGAHIGGNIKYH